MRFFCLLILFSFPAIAQDTWKDVYKESAWADRDKWQRPDEIIKHLNLKPGSKVADIGCHEGYMTMKLSKVVGENGTVYAEDISQSKLDKLKEHLEDRKISNVSIVKGNEDDPNLPENTLDAVVILDAYHEMDSHDEILQHIRQSLKPGGRLLLCEAVAEVRRTASRSQQEDKHELGMNFAIDDLKKAGFIIQKQQDPFVDRTQEKGDKMWLLVAVRK